MTRTERIKFKGTRQGVHLLIEPDPDLQEVLVELDQRLRSTDQFFRSAALMLNLGDRSLDEEQLTSLQEVLDRYGLTIVSVQASHTDTRSLFRGLGIQVEMPEGPAPGGAPGGTMAAVDRLSPDEEVSPGMERKPPPLMAEAVVVHKNLRSGQTLHHSGDICLIGDVNPGAEIIAGDNVVVWGSLRGVVQAGTRGNESAVICALELAPTQLRIASLVTRQPETTDVEIVPEMARIVDGQIMVEQWLPRSRRSRKRS